MSIFPWKSRKKNKEKTTEMLETQQKEVAEQGREIELLKQKLAEPAAGEKKPVSAPKTPAKKPVQEAPAKEPVQSAPAKRPTLEKKTIFVDGYVYSGEKLNQQYAVLPEKLAALLPGPDEIVIKGFARNGVVSGDRIRIQGNQSDITPDYIWYSCRCIPGEKDDAKNKRCMDIFAHSHHPFLGQFTGDLDAVTENMLENYGASWHSFVLTEGALKTNFFLYGGWCTKNEFRETPEYFRYEGSRQDSYHDGGDETSVEWCLYPAKKAERKAGPIEEIGYKPYSKIPSFAWRPGCRGCWEEEGHVYLLDPWGIFGIFEYFCRVEDGNCIDNEYKTWEIGVPYSE